MRLHPRLPGPKHSANRLPALRLSALRLPSLKLRKRRLAVLSAVGLVALAACGGDDHPAAEPDEGRPVEISATEYAFTGEENPNIVAGETITFVVTNEGELIHEMQVLDADGKLLQRTVEIEPGQQDEVTVTFHDSGVYQAICDIDDHLSRGQRAQFPVAEPS